MIQSGSMARVAVEIPEQFRELAKKRERSVNWLAQEAFRHYLALSGVKQERKPDASSKRQRRR
jgi:predicted transcriptional regulator